MNELTLNLDVHNKYGFYQIENGFKCEFMNFKGYYMRCNQDRGIFKKGEIYPIHSNSNDDIIYYDIETALSTKKLDDRIDYMNLFHFVPVECFEDGTFTLRTGC